MSGGIYEVEVVDEETGLSHWTPVKASSMDDAKMLVARAGAIVGRCRLVSVNPDDDRIVIDDLSDRTLLKVYNTVYSAVWRGGAVAGLIVFIVVFVFFSCLSALLPTGLFH